MDTSKPKLPHSWVARIFDKLTATYGREFSSKYESGHLMELPGGAKIDKGTAMAMETWREELGGFADRNGKDDEPADTRGRDAIAFGLENLPERAPNVIEFRNLCRQVREKPDPLKLSRQFTPEEIAANKARLGVIAASIGHGTGGLASLPTGAAVQQEGRKTSRVHPHWHRIVSGEVVSVGDFKKAMRCTQLAALRAFADANETLPDGIADWAKSHGLGNELPECQK